LNFSQAINILKPDGDSKENVVKAYRKLCKQFHPDINPHGLELMKTINQAYGFLLDNLGKWSISNDSTFDGDILAEIQAIFDKLSNCVGLTFEVCGIFLWIGGSTKEHKDSIKESGCWWSKNKFLWYWKPKSYKAKKHVTWSLDEIRESYGSVKLEPKPVFANLYA